MSEEQIKRIIEAALLAAGRPLGIEELLSLFAGDDAPPERAGVQAALEALEADWAERGVELKEVSSGYRFQVRAELGTWMARLWSERAPRYSRALIETLALIAYRQPITRAEIEEVRGVSVSSSIVKTLMEREWIRVLGHRDVPGRPALYGTTRDFLDSFNLKSLEELPVLSDAADLDQVHDDLFAAPPGDVNPIQEGDGAADSLALAPVALADMGPEGAPAAANDGDDASRAVADETAERGIEEAEEPGESARETLAEVSDETLAEVSDETLAEVSDETLAEVSDETLAEISDETLAEVSDETPAEVSDETLAEVSDETPAEVSDETPAEVSDETPAEVSDETLPGSPGEVLGDGSTDETPGGEPSDEPAASGPKEGEPPVSTLGGPPPSRE